MDPKDPEELCGSGPDEGTLARQKKRSRRVSFAAEITSVHVFDRDEEYETPPDLQSKSEKNSEMEEANEALGFLRDVGDSDDSKELMQNGEDDEDDDDDDDDDERKLFVRDLDSSSPGSAIGSATSNDEENFFGPVSTSFIRSGQLSDSAASYDNHDITMDSTTFSMHFRSIMQSASRENLKTSSEHDPTFEGRTPSNTSTPTNRSNLMALTGIKKPLLQSSVSDGKYSDGFSNDMSLVEENPRRYDYGRLSPTLDALLAEGSKDLHGNSVSNDSDISSLSNHLNRGSRFPILDRHKSNLKDLKDSGSMELHSIVTKDTPVELIYGASLKSCEESGGSANPPTDQISLDCSSSTKHALPTDASIGDHNRILCESDKDMTFDMDKVPGGDALETSGLILEVGACNIATLTPPNKTLNVNLITDHDSGFLGGVGVSRREEFTEYGSLTPKTLQNFGSPLAGSVSSLHAKRSQIFSDANVSSGRKQVSTLFARNHHSSSLKNDTRGRGEIMSPIEKSISKFKILDTSTVEDGVDNLKPFVDDTFKLTSDATAFGENSKNLKLKQVDISVTSLEGCLLSSAQKNNEQRDMVKMDAYGFEKYKNISMLRQAESVVHDGACREQISASMLSSDQPIMAIAVSPFQFSGSGKQMQQDHLASHNPTEGDFITFGENSENLKLKQVDISVTSLEGCLLSSAQKNNEQRDMVKMDAYGFEKYKNISMLRQAESVVHDGACREQISASILSSDQPIMAIAVSPFQFSGSGKQMQQDPLASHSPTEGDFITFGPDTLLTDITEDANENKQLILTPNKFSVSPERISILSRALKQRDQGNKLVSSSSGQDEADSGVIDATVSRLIPETKKDVSYLTPIAGELGSLLKEKSSQSTASIIGNSCRDPINLVKLKGMGDKQVIHDLQKESRNIMYCEIPLQHRITPSNARDPIHIVKMGGMGDNKPYHDLQNKSGNTTDCKARLQHKVTLNSHSDSLDRNDQAWMDLTKFKDRLSEKEPTEALSESASPCVLEKAKTTPFKKVLVDQMAQTPSMKEASDFLDNDTMQISVGKDPLSPKLLEYSNGNSHSGFHQDLHILQKPLPVCDVENSGRKRKSEVILTEKFQVERRTPKSPKVLEMDDTVPEFSSEHLFVRDSEVDSNQAGRVPKLSSEVFSKLYGAMKQLLSESSYELNLLQLGILEDFLGQLRKAKKYENLCSVIQFQKPYGHLGYFQQKRVAEARYLQQMLVYEQAKLQLMRVKHERLQMRVQLLQSGIQESQNLKLCLSQHLSVPGVRGVENKGNYLTLLSLDGKKEEACNKVFTMKQEIGALDKKVKSIIEYFHDSCHIKGELSYDEIVALVNDTLKKRTCCSFIRQDLQLWSVEDLESKSGHHIIAFNYHNFLFQRFKITVRPISSIVTLNKLNDANIIKAFPNINARTAFAFVFNADATDKRSRSQCLAEETQIASSLFGNLLDVIEEVQAAFIELPDLIHTRFHSPCVEELNLHLCFIHFKTGMKVILNLDMTYLNCGLYPSDVVPSFVSTDTHGVETPPPLSLSSEIQVAVERLKSGYSRIIRLCRCVTRVVQAWSR